jgi:hypothetical protein
MATRHRKPVMRKKAPKRKHKLLAWVKEWNKEHTARSNKIIVPKGFKPDTPYVGKPARGLLRQMQEKAKIPITGKFDRRTLRVLFPPTFRTRAFRVAHSQLGVHEVPMGSNDGPQVNEYQSATGAYNQAWCASFVSWVCRKVEKGFPLPGSPALADAWADAARSGKHPRLHSIGKLGVRKGDMVTYDWGGNGNADHIGFFQGWVVPFVSFRAVEGNTGDGVRVETRWMPKVLTFIRVKEQ